MESKRQDINKRSDTTESPTKSDSPLVTLAKIISTGLSEDISLNIVVGDSWRYNAERNEITFPEDLLSYCSEEVIVGFAAHEAAHKQVSRHDLRKSVFKRFFSSEARRLLLNTFEDARVDNWLMGLFQGVKHYLDIIYDDLIPLDVTNSEYVKRLQLEIAPQAQTCIHPYFFYPHLEYLLGVLYYWRYSNLPSQMINPETMDTLKRTKGNFETIFRHHPEGRASEREKFRYAEETARMIDEKILPEYEELVRASVAKIADAIKDGQVQVREKKCSPELKPSELEAEAKKMVEMQAKELADILSSKLERHDLRKPDEYRRKSEDIIAKGEQFLEDVKPVPLDEETLLDIIRKQRRIKREHERQMGEYERVYKLISHLVQTLSGMLENRFIKNRKPTFQGHFPSGQKPDLKRAMELSRKLSQKIPVQDRDLKIFLKRRVPTIKFHKIALLLDESSSMEEPKRTSALAGLLLFMEALDHVGIDYAVIGFSDKPVIHKDFGGNLTPYERRDLFDEVAMFIPSGSTADADALLLATNAIKDQPKDALRWIIMVTDGEGNVNTTGKTFAQLEKEALDEGIEVLGIGLGEEVTEVKGRYKNSIQVEEVEKLPYVLSDMLEDKLLSQDVIWESVLGSRLETKQSAVSAKRPESQDISKLLASIYLHQKQAIPTFNVRHLKRASELLGFLLNKGYPEKECFIKSLRYAFIETLDQPHKALDILQKNDEQIKAKFPNFTYNDLFCTSFQDVATPELPFTSIPDELDSMFDILIKNTSHPQLLKSLALIKKLITSNDNAYVRIPGLEACFRMINNEIIRETIIDELEKKLEDKSWSVRQVAVNALGNVYTYLIKEGKDVDFSQFEERFTDEDPSIWMAAINSMSRIWYHRYLRGYITLNEIEKSLDDENWFIRQVAERSLGKIHPHINGSGKDLNTGKFEQGLRDRNWFVRHAEAETLGRIYPLLIRQGRKIDTELLEERLKDKNILVRRSAAISLGRTYLAFIKEGMDIDTRPLEAMLEDTDWSVCQATAHVMGKLWYYSYSRGTLSLEDVEDRLDAPSWPARQAACQALGQIYPALLNRNRGIKLAMLEEKLKDAGLDKSVCQAAAYSLGRIWSCFFLNGKITIKKLETKLKDDNWFVHQASAFALLRIYSDPAACAGFDSISKIETRLLDKDWSIRKAATHASIKIFSKNILSHKAELARTLAVFNEIMEKPVEGRLTGTHSREIQIDENSLKIGKLFLDRRSIREDIPSCIMTVSGYNILETIVYGYLLKHPVLLLGPTSTGKSFLIKWLSCALGFEHISYAINPYSSKFELIGGIKPDNRGRFVWQDGIILKAAKTGLWLVLEEVNMASSEVVEILNDYLITGKISYSENGEQKEVAPHPDFRLFSTGNPESYSQRQRLSEIFLARFKIFYQKDLSEEELSQVLSSLFNISASMSLLIARFHITVQSQADSRVIGKTEKDNYAFTLRDIIRLGRRLESLLKNGSAEDEEYFKKLFLEIYCVYIARIRDNTERAALIDLLDIFFGFKLKGVSINAEIEALGAYFEPLIKALTTSVGDQFIPKDEADIIPTRSQRNTLYSIVKAMLNAEPILLAGNPSSGKTTLIRYLARQKQTNLYYVNLSSDTGLEELLGGYVQDKQGKWCYRKGLLFQALENGSWLLIDEANLSPLSEYLNTILDFGYILDEMGNVCSAHSNFRLILAINPPSVHQSRNLLSPALKSRFNEIWVEEITDSGELAELIGVWSRDSQNIPASVCEEKSQKKKTPVKKETGKKKLKTGAIDKRFTHFTM